MLDFFLMTLNKLRDTVLRTILLESSFQTIVTPMTRINQNIPMYQYTTHFDVVSFSVNLSFLKFRECFDPA